MTYNINLSNVDIDMLKAIKSLLKISTNSNINMQINKNYTFDDLNDETKQAIKEADEISKNPSKFKGYRDVDEMFESLLND